MPSSKRQRKRERQQAKREAAHRAQQRAALRRRVFLIVGLVAVIFGIGFVISQRGGDEENVASGDTTTTEAADGTSTTENTKAAAPDCPPADGSAERQTNFSAAPEMCIDTDKDYTATVETDAGTIEIDLLEDDAPQTVNNFVFLARYHFYDDVPFHRVIPDFVIQGGDAQNQDGTGDAGYKFDDELPEPGDYKAGSMAMANSGPNTNGSQFFIITSEQGAKTLVEAVGGKARYSLFATVTEGMETVTAIEADGSGGGTPEVTHKIVAVTISEK